LGGRKVERQEVNLKKGTPDSRQRWRGNVEQLLKNWAEVRKDPTKFSRHLRYLMGGGFLRGEKKMVESDGVLSAPREPNMSVGGINKDGRGNKSLDNT